jgi:hypothetical protein
MRKQWKARNRLVVSLFWLLLLFVGIVVAISVI